MQLVTKLQYALFEIAKWRISSEDTLILAPPGLMDQLAKEMSTVVVRVTPEECKSYLGIMIVEDPAISKIVVKSLISDHRAEVEA